MHHTESAARVSAGIGSRSCYDLESDYTTEQRREVESNDRCCCEKMCNK